LAVYRRVSPDAFFKLTVPHCEGRIHIVVSTVRTLDLHGIVVVAR
jgi:hypothetical protein